jgi:hypothetical protein
VSAPPPSGGARVLRGIVRCARGKADGLALFDATPRGFATSLAPLIAFPLAGAVLGVGRQGAGGAAVNLLAAVCGVLAPLVASHAIARAFGREERWLAYAVAYNWCQWAVPALALCLAVLALPAAPLLDSLHVGPNAAAAAMLLAIVGYWLWLNWFLARRALGLDRLPAGAAVLGVNGCAAAILLLRQVTA